MYTLVSSSSSLGCSWMTADFSVSYGVAGVSYILPKHLLRVTQKLKSHLEILNEAFLITLADEADHCVGQVKGPGNCVAWFASSYWRSLVKGSCCVTVHVRDVRKVREVKKSRQRCNYSKQDGTRG